MVIRPANGSMARPEPSTDAPNPYPARPGACRNEGTVLLMTPTVPAVIANMRAPAATPGRASTRSCTTGEGERRAVTAQAGSRMTATANSPITRHEPHPQVPPSVIGRTAATKPPASRSAPGTAGNGNGGKYRAQRTEHSHRPEDGSPVGVHRHLYYPAQHETGAGGDAFRRGDEGKRPGQLTGGPAFTHNRHAERYRRQPRGRDRPAGDQDRRIRCDGTDRGSGSQAAHRQRHQPPLAQN